MPKSVLVISTLDTKGQETLYLKDKLSAIGLAPILMDISGRGSDISGIDIPAARVAEAGGGSFEEIQISRDRTRITNIMMAGGSRLAAELLTQGKLDGVIALGGSTGSLMASEVMRSLP
ncbi:MAG: Tm-1-like ATP-binding domain-containing protein, partial [Deltaproteobacteria bacterium]|nr:Tm-1-like ATP-binding domain-containing protein [Deltaproteobacteria bacterium]